MEEKKKKAASTTTHSPHTENKDTDSIRNIQSVRKLFLTGGKFTARELIYCVIQTMQGNLYQPSAMMKVGRLRISGYRMVVNSIGWQRKEALMSEVIKQIVSEFEKPTIDIPPDIMDAIQNSRLDLSQNIPDPQMLVSKGNLPVCTRGNFSFVIGLPGARKSFLCSGIAGAFLNENGCMGLDNPNGTGKLLWIDTEQAPGHVAKIGRRLHRIA